MTAREDAVSGYGMEGFRESLLVKVFGWGVLTSAGVTLIMVQFVTDEQLINTLRLAPTPIAVLVGFVMHCLYTRRERIEPLDRAFKMLVTLYGVIGVAAIGLILFYSLFPSDLALGVFSLFGHEFMLPPYSKLIGQLTAVLVSVSVLSSGRLIILLASDEFPTPVEETSSVVLFQRVAARIADSFVASVLAYILTIRSLAIYENVSDLRFIYIVGGSFLVASFVSETLWLTHSGLSLGKWIFRIRVTRIDSDQPIGLPASFCRVFLTTAGFSLAIPLLIFVSDIRGKEMFITLWIVLSGIAGVAPGLHRRYQGFQDVVVGSEVVTRSTAERDLSL